MADRFVVAQREPNTNSRWRTAKHAANVIVQPLCRQWQGSARSIRSLILPLESQ